MTHREARCQFSEFLAQLVLFAIDSGYEVAFDEVTERLTDKDSTSDHMKNSLHHMGLAADLLLFRDGDYLTDTEDYRFLGEKWEGFDPLCCWGGHFGDGNHFSYAPPEVVGNRR